MKLLLISLQSNVYVTGLKYIAASVRSAGHDARILFLPGFLESELHPSMHLFISDYDPDVIGIGLMSIEFYPAKNMTLLLRQAFDIPIIWGGVHAIINPEECIRYADYVCTGEGEQVVVSLLSFLEKKGNTSVPEIPGLWVNYNGTVLRQPSATPEMDLDRIPFQEYLPDYFFGFHNNNIYNFARDERLFRMYALYGGTCHMIISTRGCPFSCSYCGNSAFVKVYGRKVRERSVRNVIDEILSEIRKHHFILYINFQDDCFFTHSKEWIQEFCAEYSEKVNLPFIVRVIPTMIEYEKMNMLRNAGLCWIVMGIQSGSDRVNYEIYDRRVRFSSVMKAGDIIVSSGAGAFYEMIVDNPYETDQERIETIQGMAQMKKPYIISLAHLTFFPGTPLAEKAIKDEMTTAESYLFRYLLKIDMTYFNKLLAITPSLPGSLIRFLNRNENQRKPIHTHLLNLLYFIVKRCIEPVILVYITARGLNYRPGFIIRTVAANWRSTFSRLVSRYLGRSDLEFDRRLSTARENMPELFRK